MSPKLFVTLESQICQICLLVLFLFLFVCLFFVCLFLFVRLFPFFSLTVAKLQIQSFALGLLQLVMKSFICTVMENSHAGEMHPKPKLSMFCTPSENVHTVFFELIIPH